MFVNILPQRWWIKRVLSNEEHFFRLWWPEKERMDGEDPLETIESILDTRNSGFSNIDGNFFVLFFPFMLSYCDIYHK